MRIERLFNVLVLGGAALSGGCSDADAGEDRERLDEGSGGAASGAGGASAAGGSASPTGSGGADPGCSAIATVSDPCGCPCCWAEGGNDEPTCLAFCASGNDGKGCCPQ